MGDKLPSRAGDLADDHPEIWDAYSKLGRACAHAGPLDERERRLVKLAMAMARGSEGATHSHVRRATGEGFTGNELRQVALLGIPTMGFPASIAALTWVDDILGAAGGTDNGDQDGID
ncbi:carboxymuconolactone decarboxylase family protein [Spiribacter vilamensis]|uniref:Alkylhydroperoxidase/carboxymuconolactone decarboxylase family protein YurZ n=1 Tax=Spiribacter vilamensis TaxID=531306 RepID=A0A4Q8CYS3_9GAMM|nr:carboxymuconolactone decarboxylase family protein [Spiribacter vilamensis]RZU98143.1 alkylhydroperoxidase/carboxymuconolactone decarboxylase family protein YurZ [Spiribacter vilamensis]TVO60956.1 carboxymuconolactone decarboxylase family protein [Spiribacter vilamensis]